MENLKVRFAPSPTGHLHIGGARTALFNYLLAKKNNGKFLVRIEDTDLNRSSYESERVIIEDLKWLGIQWDEGIDIGGEFGPYRSMERVEIYNKYVEKLLKEDKAYYCFCTVEELDEEKKKQEAMGLTPKYAGKCRDLSKEQVKELLDKNTPYTIRIKVSLGKKIIVEDQIRGNVEFESDGVGDFIIVKSDGVTVYNFGVVVDDYLMQITDVIRAEEHLSNTPRQIVIYDALGFKKPRFAHVSLILGHDKSKMSKRHGATWVEQYRDKGYLPEAINNFLALLGWSPKGEEEFFSMDELIDNFSLDRVSKNPAIFDDAKLNWMNSCYIKKTEIDRLTKLAIPHFINSGYLKDEPDAEQFEWLKKVVLSLRDGISYIAELKDKVGIYFNDDVILENDEAKEIIELETTKPVLESFRKFINEAEVIDDNFGKKVFKLVQADTNVKGKPLFMSIRVALTGQVHGPEMVDIINILGKERINNRLDKYL